MSEQIKKTTFMKSKNLKSLFLAAFVSTAFIACSSDDDNDSVDMNNSIEDIVDDTANFSMLDMALERTGLDETLDNSGSFTVFAPTNAAFTAFLESTPYNSINDVPVAMLREVLLNHVISMEVTASEITTGYVKTMAKGAASSSNTISMYIMKNDSGVTINGGAENGGAMVTQADIMADNGVIHVVDHVIALPTVTSHAIANPGLSTLVMALTRDDQPDFAGILAGTQDSPFTVFAPTNDAFASLLTELELTGLADIPQATLENTLKYHVVTEQNVLSTQLSNNMSVETFQGQSFTIGLSGSNATITDGSSRVSNIVAVDVQASNGVVHVIDRVLLPAL